MTRAMLMWKRLPGVAKLVLAVLATVLAGCAEEGTKDDVPSCASVGCTRELLCLSRDLCVCEVESETIECSPSDDEGER